MITKDDFNTLEDPEFLAKIQDIITELYIQLDGRKYLSSKLLLEVQEAIWQERCNLNDN